MHLLKGSIRIGEDGRAYLISKSEHYHASVGHITRLLEEELASIAYLITMEFAQANREYISCLGSYYEQELKALAERHSEVIDRIEGRRHLSAIFFPSAEKAAAFIRHLNKAGIDISVTHLQARISPFCIDQDPANCYL